MSEIAEQRKASGMISAINVSTRAAPPGHVQTADTADAVKARAVEADVESESEVATIPRAETDAALADASAGAPFDEDGPVWPSEAAETAFLGDEKSAGRPVPRVDPAVKTLRQAANEAEAALGPLPTLDALIARIPAETRAAVEDLFRVKFTGVRRVSPEVLK